MKRRHFLAGTAAMAGAGLPVIAQDGPITVIIPYAQGGSLDAAARPMSEQMTRILGRSVILDFKPGANGMIGTRIVQNAAPDGRTLLFTSANYTLNSMKPEAGYDPMTSFTPIATFGKTEYFLVIPASVPAKNVSEFIAFAKARPEGIFAGNAGVGSVGHMLCAYFAKAAGIKATHVPYKGGAEIIRAMAANDVHMQLTTTTATVEKLAETGKLRYLAVASEKRSQLAPNIPTLRETLPDVMALDSWSALFGPAGMPANVTKTLSDAVGRAMQAPDTAAKLAKQFMGPLYVGADDMPALLTRTLGLQKRLIKESAV